MQCHSVRKMHWYLCYIFIAVLSISHLLLGQKVNTMPESNMISAGWDEEVARKVAFASPSQRGKDPKDAADAFLTTSTNGKATIIKLYSYDPDAQTEIVHDHINVEDIIGVEIEISMGDDNKDADWQKARDVKAAEGRERMEQLEQTIGKNVLQGSESPSQQNSEVFSLLPLSSSSSSCAYLNIYVYPKTQKTSILQKCFNRGGKGNDDEFSFGTGHRKSHHRKYKLKPTEDFIQVNALIQSIRTVAGIRLKPSEERYLVMVNPYSGTKKGKRVYDTIVKPMLQEAGIEHDVFVTKRAGHATERMMENYVHDCNNDNDIKEDDDRTCSAAITTRDVSEYTGVIAMGGDGILAEILQGLKKRNDYDVLVDRINFGIIGCGTCNGLAASILYAAKEHYSQLESTFVICKGQTTSMDLSQYQTISRTYISFLTFTWAFLADCDIESERIRFMGILRNDIWGAWRLLNLRTYKAKFSYLPSEAVKDCTSSEIIEKKIPNYEDDILPSDWKVIEGEFIIFWASHVTHSATNLMNSPESKLDDGIMKVFIVRQPCSRFELLKMLLGLETGSHASSPKAEFIDCAAYRLDPEQIEGVWPSFNDIDGEVVEPGRIQAFVQSSAIKFFS